MRLRLQLFLSVLVVGVLGLLPAAGVSAQVSGVTRTYLIATGPLCGLPEPDPCPAIAMAANGHTIEITGAGTFTIDPLSGAPRFVTGGGTLVHKNAAGNFVGSGTWAAEQLLGFKSYGTDQVNGLTIEGGLLLMRVRLSAGFDAILQVDCLVGKPPAGAVEGVRLTVQGALNFNKEVSGLTVYLPD